MSDEFPSTFTSAAAWTANDLEKDPDQWLSTLSCDDNLELQAAAELYLAPRFERLKEKLLSGNGVEVIRGLAVQNLSLEMAACIFCGIGSHLGSARSQNAQGHILGHVRDLGKSSSDTNTRIYQTAERQTFHTDSADVVGLLCWRQAKSGGESLLVSALSLYNEFKRRRPDLLPLLFEPIATDRRGEIPTGALPYVLIPIFSWFDDHLTVFYQRQYIESAQRFDDAPRLTDQHIEALDLFDTLANDPALHFAMQLEAGDMQFVYNHSQLHDRTGFEDWPELEKRRHMLRLWLSIDGDRALPECSRTFGRVLNCPHFASLA